MLDNSLNSLPNNQISLVIKQNNVFKVAGLTSEAVDLLNKLLEPLITEQYVRIIPESPTLIDYEEYEKLQREIIQLKTKIYQLEKQHDSKM
jgi:hypothetical protein